MSEIRFRPVPPEPAHPAAVRLHDDLVAIYGHIRSKYQVKIDRAFDQVSRQIGFVVTTMMPVLFEVGGKASPKGIIVTDGKTFQGTLFDQALTEAVKGIKNDPVPALSQGTYKLYLLWFEALKLKLRTDWIEPAHSTKRVPEIPRVRREWVEPSAIIPGVREPAHWFDPGIAIGADEAVLIEVIDEVYPELRLTDRIASYRKVISEHVWPEVKEPAHFRKIEDRPRPEEAMEVLSELASVLRRYGF